LKDDRALGFGFFVFRRWGLEMKTGFCGPDQEKADSKIKGASKVRLSLCLHITFSGGSSFRRRRFLATF
jgi:hypothetical protein